MRLSKVTKDYNVSLQRVVAVLQEHGVAVEPNLNSKIDDKYAELFAEKFGADKARKDQASISLGEGDRKHKGRNMCFLGWG